MLTIHAKKICCLTIFIMLNACSFKPVQSPKVFGGEGQLELNLKGFRNSQGLALIFVYSGPHGFPDGDAPQLIRVSQAIKDQKVDVVLQNIPFQAYAVAVLHDENSNDKMDKTLLGFPQEGFGFSRNPEALFGPPEYEQARFLFVTDRQKQTIELQYPKRRKLRPAKAGTSSMRLK